MMQVRHYHSGEELTLWEIFYHTIRQVNIKDYSQEQVEAWAPDEIDEQAWRQRIAGMNPFVCLHGEQIVGYAGLLDSGYVDHFYVHHQWQRRGVGRLLMQQIESTAEKKNIQELTSDVSITAKPFFTAHGFEVVTPQQVMRQGVVFENFKMKKKL